MERLNPLRVRTARRLGEASGVTAQSPAGQDPELRVTFQGPQDAYVRRELAVPRQVGYMTEFAMCATRGKKVGMPIAV